jgi:hypothetical protein
MATAMMELGSTAVGTRKLPYTEEQWKIPGCAKHVEPHMRLV